jgi:signal transduction histidine kinase/ActR/RegA family two-component response regulator
VLLLTLVATALVHSSVETQRDQLLEQRVSAVGASMATGLGQVSSTLDVLSNIAVETPDGVALFDDAARPLITGAVLSIGVAAVDRPGITLAAAVGDAAAGDELTGARADLVDRAKRATSFVSGVVPSTDGDRLMYARRSADGSRVVVREVEIDPTTPAESIRGEAVDDLDVTVYASDRVAAADLVLTTTRDVPLTGPTHTRILHVGDDDWRLVAVERHSLLSPYVRLAPWTTFIVGVVLAVLLTLLLESLVKRRAYALEMVDARTSELQATLEEQARLEAEARRASAEAFAANRAKSEFLSRMSHELRTPLSAVIGFAQIMEIEDLPEQHAEPVQQILKGGRHLLALINEILDISRIESGDFTLSPEPVHAGDTLRDALELMRPIADHSNIHLVGDAVSGCDAYVFADRQRLKQILLNLLSNAVKYNRVGGTVALSCETSDSDRFRLVVADTGPGIPAEQLDLLFEPFERLGAEHGEVEGTGIGLALCRRLAEAMGGSIGVDTAPGRGSTFWVELPRVEAPVTRLDRLGPEPMAASGPREGEHCILYIEDNLANLKLVERILAPREDVRLVVAMQGRLGVELAHQHSPELILLDLHLPDVDGDVVLRQLREDPSTASIPVVILSADATATHMQRILAAGAHSYLTKPIDVRMLLHTIDDILGQAD